MVGYHVKSHKLIDELGSIPRRATKLLKYIKLLNRLKCILTCNETVTGSSPVVFSKEKDVAQLVERLYAFKHLFSIKNSKEN